jgi:hypothetical protein
MSDITAPALRHVRLLLNAKCDIDTVFGEGTPRSIPSWSRRICAWRLRRRSLRRLGVGWRILPVPSGTP